MIKQFQNGCGMPDLSLIKPLCDMLDISINYLLSGERIDESNYKEKLEENIMNTINYTDNKINKTARTFKIIIGIIIILISLLFTMFCVDVRRMNMEKSTIFI